MEIVYTQQTNRMAWQWAETLVEISQSDPASMDSKLEMCLSVELVFVQHQIGLSLTTVFIFISSYNTSDQV